MKKQTQTNNDANQKFTTMGTKVHDGHNGKPQKSNSGVQTKRTLTAFMFGLTLWPLCPIVSIVVVGLVFAFFVTVQSTET
jgi:hypothetical protein